MPMNRACGKEIRLIFAGVDWAEIRATRGRML